MRIAFGFAVLLVVTAIAADARACSVCIPRCEDAIVGVTGRVNCASTASYCKIWGDYCAGDAGCECGTMGCNPCNATCNEPEPEQWRLVQVEVQTPRQRPDAQWILVSVTKTREHS